MGQDETIEELSGTYFEIGQKHGQNNADRMRYLLREFGVDLAGSWKESSLIRPLEKHLPELVEEIYGIVAGSGLSLREVCALSFLIDLGTASSACTGIIFADGPDGPIVGKTSDCTPGVQQKWLRQRLIRPLAGFDALIHSHVGSPNAEMGMNEKGLALGISGLFSRSINFDGVGWQQDIRAILHACETTEQAIAMLRRIPIRMAGYGAVIGDATGDVAIVEKVVGALSVRRPISNVAYEANVPSCEEVRAHAASIINENGLRRISLLQRLCKDEASMDFSIEGMIQLFSVHDDPVGICQHGPELHSNTGFFMVPRAREVHVIRGYTCQRSTEVIRFN